MAQQDNSQGQNQGQNQGQAQTQNEPQANQVQGEGDYVSARKYQQEQASFAQDQDKVERGAREAEDALEGPEGEELEAAREKAARGEHGSGPA